MTLRLNANKYCSLTSLRNESDVEQFLVMPFLKELGYGPDYLETKTSIQQFVIGKGRTKKLYFPDYLGYTARSLDKPVLVIDAKSPAESAEDGVQDSQLYASVLRRKMASPKPDQYCIGVNGHLLIVKHYDSDLPLHTLTFTDFVDGNARFETLKKELSRIALAPKVTALTASQFFEFRRVASGELPSVFEMCHKKIWKAEKSGPASAFYEFAKVMFIKIDEDRRIHARLVAEPTGLPAGEVPKDWVRFSVHWINEMEESTDNPIDTILFRQLTGSLEEQIQRGEKKRIFDEGQSIDLAPSTLKEVIKILEHLDLWTVDEDLNGRLFETFLSATMRGEALGQFFTPRSVVKFMVQLAHLQATPHEMDTVLDGCCGTGGFLIEAMAVMGEALLQNKSLSVSEREGLLKKLRTEALWGIDAGDKPQVARIARLNMLLHRDGGSRIYFADALDKQIRSESGLPLHTRLEMDELRLSLVEKRQRFSVVLTNPPFAMTYERKNAKELTVLRDYLLAVDKAGKTPPSLKSSVMFLERYSDLLKENGKLLTVMDDSVLNTLTDKPFREFILANFVVKAVISLPKNTFVNAQGSVSTSVLYLRKKVDPLEPQPEVFMAICGNVGHTNSGKARPLLNELPEILKAYEEYETTGQLPQYTGAACFTVGDLTSANPTLRLDVQWFNPRYFATMSTLRNIAQQRDWETILLSDLLRPGKDSLTGGATPLGAIYPDEGPKFIRVQNVHPNVLQWNSDNDPCVDSLTHNTLLKRSQLGGGMWCSQ